MADYWIKDRCAEGQLTKDEKISRRQDIKILGLEYTSVALSSHSRSELGGVPKEVSKSPSQTKDLKKLPVTNDELPVVGFLLRIFKAIRSSWSIRSYRLTRNHTGRSLLFAPLVIRN